MTINKELRWFLTIFALACIIMQVNAQSNSALACNDLVQISLDAECNGVTPDMFLEGDAVSPTPILYELVITGPNGVQTTGIANPLANNPPIFISNGSELVYPIGGPYQYLITATWQNGQTNSCWGNVIFESNIIPETAGGACFYDPSTMTPDQVTCEIICGEDPWYLGLSTTASVLSMLPPCIDGDLEISTETTGDLCSGEFHVVSYVLEVVQHGVPAWITLFQEAYWVRPVPLGQTNCAAEANNILDLVPGSTGIDKEEALLALMGMPTDIDGDGQNGLSNIIDNWIQPDGELTLPCDADYSPEGIAALFDDPYTFPTSGSKLPHIMEWVFLAYPWFFTDLDGDGMLSQVSEIQPISSGKACNLTANYTDSDFPICGNNKKVFRQWTILDWCSGEAATCEQLIVIGGEESPVFSPYEPTEPIRISTQPWTCTGCFTVPDLEHPVSNKCGSNTLRITIDLGKDGIISKEIGEQVCIEEGEYTITYVAINGCGTTTTLDKPIIVTDLVPPVPVCEDELVVSLTPEEVSQGNGGGKIFSQSFDNGSHDAGCGPVWFKVIRMEELNGTRHGYWNFNNAGVIPDYSDYPEDNPAAICTGDNGDDWRKCHYDCDTKVDYRGEEYADEPWANDGIPDNDRDCSRETGNQVFFDDFVKFCCGDVDREIMVVLRVYDRDPGDGPIQPWRMDQSTPYNGIPPEQYNPKEECTNTPIVNDLAGRFNDCMIRVKIQLKNPTVLICPDDVGLDVGSAPLSCEDDTDPSLNPRVGEAEAYGLCGDPCIAWYDVSDDVAGNNPSCGERILYRAWFVDTDCDGELGPLEEFTEQCNQLIFIQDTNDFDPNTIKWPVHYIGGFVDAITRECNPNYWPNEPLTEDNMPINEDPGGFFLPDPFDCVPEETCEPEWLDPGCGLVGSSVSIDTVYFEDDACVKILKEWSVIDWCTWEPNAGGGDTDNDDFEYVEDWTPGECEKETCSPYYLRYTSVDEDGYYSFTQVIKVVNDTAPTIASCDDICVPAEDECLGDLIISNSATDSEDCASDWLKWNVEVFDVHWSLIRAYNVTSGNSETVTIHVTAQEGLPIGTYRVMWRVSDGCNNITDCTQLYTITDKKAPTPYCIQNLSTATMSTNGSVEIWASDFNIASEDNCTDSGELLFSFSGEDYEPNLVITCDDIANGISETFELQMWVWDEAGNRDFCSVNLRVDDNGGTEEGACDDRPNGSMAQIAGEVYTEGGLPVDGVDIVIDSDQAEYPRSRETGSDGNYLFENIRTNYSYNIAASKVDENFLNGVSTIDLVLIQRHILGVQLLDSPYKILAADVNGDNRITAVDLVTLRKLILGISEVMPSNWMFVNAASPLSIDAPWKHSEEIRIKSLEGDYVGNFMGIKVGDVNGSVTTNNLDNSSNRNTNRITLSTSDVKVAKGDEVSVSMDFQKLVDIAGMQYTLRHEGLEFKRIEAAKLDVNNQHLGIHAGSLSMAWHTDTDLAVQGSLFTIVFQAQRDVLLSEVLRFDSSITEVVAYTGPSLTSNDIVLAFDTALSDDYLSQNEPNPFRIATTIGFYLQEDAAATLTIFDASGRSVLSITDTYVQGSNEILIDKSQLPQSGVYMYKLESRFESQMKKMILVE